MIHDRGSDDQYLAEASGRSKERRHKGMMKRYLASFSATLVLGLSAAAWAVETGTKEWSPLSSTASAITGPVTLTADRLQMANRSFSLSLARGVEPAHLAGAAKIADMASKPSSAKLFKTRIPGTVKLLQSNTICGGKDATWMLAVFADNGLALAFFSGTNEPQMDYGATSAGHTLCGTFAYVSSAR